MGMLSAYDSDNTNDLLRLAAGGDGDRRSAWKFTLDPTKSPKYMDLTGFEGRGASSPSTLSRATR
jgi:hypothetical protein